MDEVDWARLKAHELRALAARNAAVILPVASIEQHGPHLPVMTDTRLGHEIALRAARKVQADRPCVVAPVTWQGLSEHHMPYGGTLTLSHETFRLVLRDLVTALVRQGFRDILISNSHGGNIIAMQNFVDEFARSLGATLVATTYVMEAGADLAQHLEDQDGIQHACEGETAMMMVCEPVLVDASDLASHNAPGDGPSFLRAGQASYRWRPFAHLTGNGVAGRPEKASADKGEKMLEAGAEALARLIRDPDTWAAPQDMRGSGTMGVPFGDAR
jgi:creatinine amidohydrolase